MLSPIYGYLASVETFSMYQNELKKGKNGRGRERERGNGASVFRTKKAEKVKVNY